MEKSVFYKVLSIVFHPIFIPLVATVIHLNIFAPYLSKDQSYMVLYIVTLGSLILPLSTLLLLIKAKIINSIYLEKRTDRIIPIFTTGVYIFVTAKLLMKNNIGTALHSYLIGVVITLSVILILSRKLKISIHSAAIASVTGFLIFISYNFSINLTPILAIFIIITGLISTARLKLKAHTDKEVYLGIIIGVIPQLAFLFLK
ncbi:MAG: hypothetical protein ABFR62_04835 [Bacteroidota bacterium]